MFTYDRTTWTVVYDGDELTLRCLRENREWHFGPGWSYAAVQHVIDQHDAEHVTTARQWSDIVTHG